MTRLSVFVVVALASLASVVSASNRLHHRAPTTTSTSHSVQSTTTLSSTSLQTVTPTASSPVPPAAVTTETSGQNTIVIVISQAGLPSPSPSTPNSTDVLGGAFAPSTSPLSPSIALPIPITVTAIASPSPSTSLLGQQVENSSNGQIAGMSTGAFAGLIVAIVIASLLVIGVATFLIRYLKHSRERREWDDYQHLAAGGGVYGAESVYGSSSPTTPGAGGVVGGEVSEKSGNRDSMPMMTVTGANGLASARENEWDGVTTSPSEVGRGDRNSVYSTRWARSNY